MKQAFDLSCKLFLDLKNTSKSYHHNRKDSIKVILVRYQMVLSAN